MKRTVGAFIYLLLNTILIISCVDEKPYKAIVTPGGTMAEVSFLLDIPQTLQISTRAREVGTIPENAVNDVYILAFDKTTQKLITKAKGKNLTIVQGSDNNNKICFKATLPIGKEHNFIVLTNAETKLAAIEVGMNPEIEKPDVMNLVVSQQDKWNSTSPAIPMWAEKNLNLTASSIPTFDLTRMLARINLEVQLDEISPGLTKDNFKLTSIHYYNYNTAGALVPDIDNYDTSKNEFTAPTIPAAPGTKTGEALIYDNEDITDEKECKHKIYVFEAAHNGKTYTNPADNSEWINNPCLVIGGRYKTADGTWLDETFYRIDFIRKDKTDPNNIQDVWLSVIRNFSYNVTITDVSGSGFPDPGTALTSAPINMEANILEWNESDMGEIVFDGTFYLSVSRDKLKVGQAGADEKREENTLYVKTDYIYKNDRTHANSGWHVEKYVDAEDETQSVTWLKLNPEKGAPDNRVEAYFTYDENTTSTTRTAIAWIAAGRLRYPVYVTQNVYSIHIVDPASADDPLSELRFEVPANGSQAQEKQFKVIWKPSGATVGISQTSLHSWAPFEPNWLDPNPSLSWNLTGTGTQIYTVTAPPVSESLLQQDPFYERESTYTFTLTDGVETQTANISLHQIHYNIQVDQYQYRLNGKTHHLSVRSNTEWEITDIEEWLYNKPPDSSEPSPVILDLKPSDDLRIGTTGGPDISGDAVAFTVVNQDINIHKKKWGTVFVTFTSPTGKFAPVRVGIPFPARDITLLGLGYARDVRAYNAAYSTTYHLQGINRMLTASVNFGSDESSTVKVGNFNIVGYNCEGLSGPPAPSTPDANWRTGDLKKWLNQHNPDIITICYSMILNPEEEDLIIQYLDHGGTVIMHYGEGTQVIGYVRRFLGKVFNRTFDTTNSIQYGSASGWVYRLEDGPEYADDPILNGPFGDARGGYFGIVVDHVGILGTSIQNDAYNYMYRRNVVNQGAGGTVAQQCVSFFRHKTKNLVFIGNGAGTGSYYPQQGNSIPYYDPMRNDDEFRPILRQGYGMGVGSAYPKYSVCNSIVYMNAVAWAIENTMHVPPAGGY